MTLRDILVHIDGEQATAAGERRRAYAISLASSRQAHLTGLVFALEPAIYAGVAVEFPVELYEQMRKSSVEAAHAAADAMSQAARREGVGCEVHIVATPGGTAAQKLADHARTSDLVVVGQPERDDPLIVRDLLIEGALFDSGRPALIVPYAGPAEAKLDRAIVAWDGGREAARAVHDALPLLERARSVEVLVIGDEVRAARMPEPGADLALHLARHGLDATARHLPAGDIGVADALLSHAADYGADLIVMGGYGRSRLREFILGGTTRSILRSMTVPVLISH